MEIKFTQEEKKQIKIIMARITKSLIKVESYADIKDMELLPNVKKYFDESNFFVHDKKIFLYPEICKNDQCEYNDQSMMFHCSCDDSTGDPIFHCCNKRK